MTHREIYGKTVDLNADLITVNNRGSLTQVGQLGGTWNKSFYDLYENVTLKLTNVLFYWRYQLTGIQIWLPTINDTTVGNTTSINLYFQINGNSSDFPILPNWNTGGLIFENISLINFTTGQYGAAIVFPTAATIGSQARNGLDIKTTNVTWVTGNVISIVGFSYVELSTPL
jgi:hypothetical protein